MSGYCFFGVREITDQAKVAQYMAGVFSTVECYGGRYLVLGGGLISSKETGSLSIR